MTIQTKNKITHIFLIFLFTILISSCALQNKSIDINDIKSGQTIITGKVTLKHHQYLSGKYLKDKTISYKPIEIAIKQYDSIEDVPKAVLSYAGVTRVLSNETNTFTFPVEPGKYYVMHLSAPDSKLMYAYTENYSKDAIEFNILPNKINYVGHIEINTFKEIYEDTNKDGLISKDEFKSNVSTYDEFYEKYKSIWEAEGTLINTFYTFGYTIEVKDEYDSYDNNISTKSLAKVIKY